MAIFNPIDTMGPAHRGSQTLQQLAQTAAQNVMRRQRMRSLLQQGARSAAGGAQPLRNSTLTRPTGVRGATMRNAVGNLGGVSAGGTRFADPDGTINDGGGGYDYPSLPDPNDPSQSHSSTVPGSPGHPGEVGSPVIDPSTGQPGYGGAQWVNPGDGTTALGGPSGDPYHDTQPDPGTVGNQQMIHLGGGLYYDPATDSVHGGSPHGK